MKIHIERDKCVASGQCVMLAPDVFDQDDDGIVTTLVEDTNDAGGSSNAVSEAIRVCPARAISLAE
jgi:ferredoxin